MTWSLDIAVGVGAGHHDIIAEDCGSAHGGSDDGDHGFGNYDVDQFTSLFLCPDPIQPDSLARAAHLIFSEGG